ncbi:MAG: hypothetical protein FWD83_00930 [Promicromonosporaceae bacterium]|nr:hypothetical protein [Promicromonosporaceae bacterium]
MIYERVVYENNEVQIGRNKGRIAARPGSVIIADGELSLRKHNGRVIIRPHLYDVKAELMGSGQVRVRVYDDDDYTFILCFDVSGMDNSRDRAMQFLQALKSASAQAPSAPKPSGHTPAGKRAKNCVFVMGGVLALGSIPLARVLFPEHEVIAQGVGAGFTGLSAGLFMGITVLTGILGLLVGVRVDKKHEE